MSNNKTAIREYVRTVYKLHKLTLEKLDYFLNLPSIRCESRTDIKDNDAVLLKVYKTHGSIKFTILNFYSNYVKNLEVFISTYCDKHSIEKPPLDTDWWIFNYEIKSTIQLIESKLDTQPALTSASNQETIDAIYLMFESIDALMSLEYKLCAVPNYDKLDLLKDARFKLFRSNQLFYRVRNILHSFPQSGYYNATKTSFLYPLEKLSEDQD